MDSKSDTSPGRRWAIGLGIPLAGLIVLAAHCHYYMPFLADDALISARYAQRLLQGHGLTWTDGHPVEGYSNLLWVLLTALAGRCGMNLVTGMRLLGFASAAMLVGSVVFGHRAGNLRQTAATAVGVLTVVLAGPIAIWTIGGLEAVLVAALLAWAAVTCYPIFEQEEVHWRHPLIASVFLALLCITRPDGALFTAAIVFALLLAKGFHIRTFRVGFLLALLPAVFYLGQLAFRLAYYGQWVPNTALVKIAPSTRHLARGAVYIAEGTYSLGPMSAVAVVLGLILLFQRTNRSTALLLIVPAVAWSLYIAAVGGDTFPGWRQMVPLVPLMALLLAQGIERLLAMQPSNNRPSPPAPLPQAGEGSYSWTTGRSLLLVSIVLAVALAAYGHRQFGDQRNRLALTERWEWDGQVVGRMLQRGFGPRQPLLAATACGCLPYWSELPCIDMLGLNDYYLPRNRPDDFGQGMLSHELGDGQYVFDRRPELIVFGSPNGLKKARFLSGRQMQQKPEFYELYTPVTFEGRQPYTVRSLIWVRRNGEKIGIRALDDEINVPAYLLNAYTGTVAYLDAAGQFVVALTSQQPAGIKDLAVSQGQWLIEADAPGKVNVSVHSTEEGAALWDAATATLHVIAENDARLDITLRSAARRPMEVRKLVLVRLGVTDQ